MKARSWTQPLAPALAGPDAFLPRRLLVTDAWRDEAGEWHRIAKASTVALWSILGYLRWHAPAIAQLDVDGPAAAARDLDAYLRSRPLVAAIEAELERRGAVPAGEAFAYLRAIGVAPWELPSQFVKPRRRHSAG